PFYAIPHPLRVLTPGELTVKKAVSRRKFLSGSLAAATAAPALTDLSELIAAPNAEASRQATGVKVGEVTDRSAIVWMRVTAQPGPRAKGIDFPSSKPITLPKDFVVEDLRGACPGASGRVRLRYGPRTDLADAQVTPWASVTPRTD